MIRLAVPSDGPLSEAALLFLECCGIQVFRTDSRRYTATIPSLPGITVNFQRGSDIASKVEEASADLGIVGQDHFLENRREGGNSSIIIDGLGFGRAEIVIGVPDSWIDVSSMADLADLSVEFRGQGKDLRVATKYPRLVERHLISGKVNFFSLVPSSGTLEAAPAMGYADIIADVSSTGTTLRENRLKTILGGSIIASQACLIGNYAVLASDTSKYDLARTLIERVEAHLHAKKFYIITANIKSESPDKIASYILQHTNISELPGPTISRVHAADNNKWHAVTVIVEKANLLEAVDRFREIGGASITVSQPTYVFHTEAEAITRLPQPR